MRRRDRVLAVAAVLLLLGAFKLTQQVYRWYAYADERTEIGMVEGALRESGLGVVRTQLEADSLRRLVEEIDADLAERRETLQRYERQVLLSRVPRSVETAYRQDLNAYNRRVRERNDLFQLWRVSVEANHEYVELYNALVDSVRVLATQIGEPYYPILSPAEIAEQAGLLGAGSDPS